MLSQVLLTLVVAIVVLYGFKAYDGMRRQRDRAEERASRASKAKLTAQDLTRCPQCGSYTVADNLAACDRPDCPVRSPT